jgi:hypothetical protein
MDYEDVREVCFVVEENACMKEYIIAKLSPEYFVSAKVIDNAGEYSVHFIFGNKKNKFFKHIVYNMFNLTPTTAFRHATSLENIYRTCVDSNRPMPNMFPIFCNGCGKLFWTSKARSMRTEKRCMDCRRQELAISVKVDKEYVYLMKSALTGLLKIGISNDPFKRAQALSTGNGGKIDVIRTIPGSKKIERSIQERFSEYRVGGEWFSDNEEIYKYFEDFTK